ncbi:hypothetical protein CAJAP_03046 [Camponotus japonicus]
MPCDCPAFDRPRLGRFAPSATSKVRLRSSLTRVDGRVATPGCRQSARVLVPRVTQRVTVFLAKRRWDPLAPAPRRRRRRRGRGRRLAVGYGDSSSNNDVFGARRMRGRQPNGALFVLDYDATLPRVSFCTNFVV